ncbi:hypothetical protein OKW41_000345 [Paraburkholderia sp. UCT70]
MPIAGFFRVDQMSADVVLEHHRQQTVIAPLQLVIC